MKVRYAERRFLYPLTYFDHIVYTCIELHCSSPVLLCRIKDLCKITIRVYIFWSRWSSATNATPSVCGRMPAPTSGGLLLWWLWQLWQLWQRQRQRRRQPQVAFHFDNSCNFGSCDSRLCKSQIRGFWRMRNQQKSPLDNRGGTEYQRFIQETEFQSFWCSICLFTARN